MWRDYRKRSRLIECAKEKVVYRVRRENKNENAGRLEQSGIGSDEARIAVEVILLVFVFEPGKNAFKFHRAVNLPEVGVRVGIVWFPVLF